LEFTMSERTLPYFQFSGDPTAIGHAHGESLRKEIRQTFEFYRGLVPHVTEPELEKLALRFASSIQRFQPRYSEEIEAIAASASLPAWKIYLLNSRTELIRQLKPPTECTGAYFAQSGILGENWDWAKDLEALIFVTQITYPSEFSILMMSEPGIIGKIGCNSAGLGVCLNILRCDKPLNGVPIHILLRAVLDQPTVADALGEIQRAPLGTMSNLIIGDANGNGIDVEIAGDCFTTFGESEPYILHTNHYLAADITNPVAAFQSSYRRYQRGKEILEAASQYDMTLMKQLLGDCSGEELAICSRYYPDEIIGSVGTVCSVIFDLPRRQMNITAGNPIENGYQTFQMIL